MSMGFDNLTEALEAYEDRYLCVSDLAEAAIEVCRDPEVCELAEAYQRIYRGVIHRAGHDDLDAAEAAFMSAVRKLCEAEKGGDS